MSVRVLAWLLAIAYGIVLVAGAISGFPERSPAGTRMPYLSDKPIGEDGYYMLTVAWRFGGGDGLTYNADGTTTGIQPLSTIIYGGIAAVVRAAGGDRWTFARVMLAAGIVQWLLLASMMRPVTRALVAGRADATAHEAVALSALFALLSYSVFRISTYALETTIYLLLLSTCLILAVRGIHTTAAAVRFGAVAGLTILARIDFGLVLAIVLVVEILRARLRWREGILVGIVAALVSSPWFAFVYNVTGHAIPTSGRAQTEWPPNAAEWLTRASAMADALTQHIAPWLYLPAGHTALSTVLGTNALHFALTLLAAVGGGLIARRGWLQLRLEARSALVPWLLAFGALCAVYLATFRPVFFYVRYSAPALVIAMPLLAVGIASLGRPRRLAAGLSVAMLAGFALTAWVTLHTGRIGNSHSISAGLVARHLPAPAVVGAFQSGAVGYFNANVVNLDGKINALALDALRQRTFPEYVARRGITHVVDWPELASQPPFDRWPDCGLGSFGYSSCRVRLDR